MQIDRYHPLAGDLSIDRRIVQTSAPRDRYLSAMTCGIAASCAPPAATGPESIQSALQVPSSTAVASGPIEVWRKSGPINVVYITSLREIGLDEQVGREIIDPENGRKYGRRVGNLEDLVHRLNDPTSQLYGRINLVGIIYDDDSAQLAAVRDAGLPWDTSLKVPQFSPSGQRFDDRSLASLEFNLSSDSWVKLKKGPSKDAAKAAYERKMGDFLELVDADLMLSDSYVRIFSDEMLRWAGTSRNEKYGHIINVHPAIARVGDPRRLPGVTPTRDCITRQREGWVIVDDKLGVDLPDGPEKVVMFEGKERRAREVAPISQKDGTGVTVHVTARIVDNGHPLIEEFGDLPNKEDLTKESLRTLNYELKKRAVARALVEYPHIAEVAEIVAARRKLRGVTVAL